MLRSYGFARALSALAVALAMATSSMAQEDQSQALRDPAAAQRSAASKRAPAGTAVPTDRYLAAAAHMENMPSYSTAAPSLDSTATVVGTWTNLGPSNVGGRTRALIVQNATNWFAAGVAGGVFKTTDGGLNWTSLGDAMANMAVTALASKPTVPTTLLAGTGEGFFNEDLVRGAGIFQSVNSGTTWTQIASTNNSNFYYVNDIVFGTVNTRVYAATSTGVFRSLDSGTTWVQILSPLINGGCLDLALVGGATDTILASCGNQVQAKVYKTEGSTAVDIGSWSVVLNDTGMGRTSLATPIGTAPSVVYALSANLTTSALHAVFKSTDGGLSWTKQLNGATDVTDNRLILQNAKSQRCSSATEAVGWYANSIAIDPADATGNTVWSGSIDLYRSTDSGATWGPMSSWFEEASAWFMPSGQHAIVFGSGLTLVAGDGGISKMTTAPSGQGSFAACPAGGTVSTAVFSPRNNGYAVTQFNSAAVDPSDVAYLGGTQRGTLRGTDAAGASGWTRILSGFGGASALDPTDPNVIYLVGEDGAVQKSTNGGTSFTSQVSGLSGAFKDQPGFALDPTNPNRLWLGGDQIFRSDDGANTWTAASAALASKATAIAVSPTDPEVVLVGTETGTVYRTTAASSTTGSTVWASVLPRSGYVSSLAFDPLNSSVAYVTYATFGGVHLWKSTNGGSTWVDVDGAGATGIPDVPVHSVVVDPTATTRLYAGSDVGVFVSTNSGVAWSKENTGFPNVITERLLSSGANLYAFTHGRGAWRVPITTSGASTTTVGFGAPHTTVTENATTVTIDVVLSTADHNPTAGAVTVAYATAAGTALAGADFTSASGTLNFPAASAHGATQSIVVTILEDAVGEPTKTFNVNLSASTGALLALSKHVVAITDDGDPQGLSVNDVTVAESTALTPANFTVTLYPAPTGTVTVAYATLDGTAVNGTTGDYTAVTGVLTFTAGQTSKTVSVPIKNDTLAEPAENFSLKLSGAVGAAIVDDTGVGTITDNDPAGSMQFSAATYTIAETGPKATVTVSRTGGTASAVTVQYATSNGSAVQPGDYTAAAGTLTFGANVTSLTFTVTVINDTLDEADETVNLSLLNPVGYGATLGAQATATLTITDNDVGGNLDFSAATYAAVEGTSVVITVKRTLGLASAVTVNYLASNGTATSPLDYAAASGTLTFNANDTTKTVSIPLVAENPIVVEGDETFQIALSGPTGGGVLGTITTSTVTINDASPKVSFQLTSTSVSEALTSVVLNVLRTGPTSTAVTVPYFTTDGTAKTAPVGSNPADYTATSANLVIPAGATSKTLAIVLKTDTVVEGPENFTVTLGTPVGGILGTNTVNTVTITDNDLGGVFSFGAATYSANEPLSGTLPAKATITVKRTGGTASNVTVHWSTSDGTATVVPVLPDTAPDYTAGSGTLTFDSGILSKTFTVDVLTDSDIEGYQAFNVTLDTPTGGSSLGAPSTSSVTVVDKAPVVLFSATAITSGEGVAKATFTLKRTGVLTGALTVGIADLGTGTATAGVGNDYNNVPGSVVMPTSVATKTFTIDVLQDSAQESTETVNLGLTSCSPSCSIGPPASANATLSIVDDEPLVSFSLATYAVTEGTAAVTITLKRTNSTALPLTVGITDLGTGTATAGLDYGTVPATVVIPAAAATKTFTIPIVNDLLAESSESINLQITSVLPNPGGYIGTLPNTTVNIADNEPSIAFGLATYTVSEPLNTTSVPTKATVVVKRTGTLTQVSTVNYVITAGTATAGVDYNPFNPVAASGTLTFASGVASINIVIDILADLLNDGPPNETILLTLSSPTAAKLGTIVNSTVSITDND